MGLFNDSYDIAKGVQRMKVARDTKEAAKAQAKAQQDASKKAQKSNIEKAKDDNLFI